MGVSQESIAHVRIGCDRAKRDIDEIDMWWLPLTNLAGNRDKAVDEIAMTLASAGSHLSRFTTKGKQYQHSSRVRWWSLGDTTIPISTTNRMVRTVS